MAASVSTATGGGFVVVTHVYPAPQGATHQPAPGIQGYPAPQGAALQHSPDTKKFRKGVPLILGTVEIMIGLLMLLLGISMGVTILSVGLFSGVFVWGAILYVVAGSLTLAAGRSMNRCLVNASLGLSVAAAVASFISTIVYFMDAFGLAFPYCSNFYICPNVQMAMGISGVMAVFSLLEFAVSVTLAVFACKATCGCCTPKTQSQQMFFVNGPEGSRVTMEPLPTLQPLLHSQAPPTPQFPHTSQAPPTAPAHPETTLYPTVPEKGPPSGLGGEPRPPAYSALLG